MNKITFKKLHQSAKIPVRAFPEDAGLDLSTLEGGILLPGEGRIFKTGLAMAIPEGQVGLIWDRSSMGKRGVKTLGGVIDSGYRGEVGIILWNITKKEIQIEAGERIAQLLIQNIQTPAIEEVIELPPSVRGEGGFGSSGKF